MQVLAVFSSTALGSSVVKTLEGHGVSVSLHLGIDRLMSASHFERMDGLIIEDDERHLGTWLPLLTPRLPSAAPIVVYGSGACDAMAKALCCGAHDYATAYEGTAALWSRLSARLEAARLKSLHPMMRIGSYVLDRKCQMLSLGTAAETLTSRETALLAALAARPGWVVTLESICLELCRRSADLSHRSIEQHVYRLRKKIDDLHRSAQSDGGLRLASVYGVGYRLDLLEVQQSAVDLYKDLRMSA